MTKDCLRLNVSHIIQWCTFNMLLVLRMGVCAGLRDGLHNLKWIRLMLLRNHPFIQSRTQKISKKVILKINLTISRLSIFVLKNGE